MKVNVYAEDLDNCAYALVPRESEDGPFVGFEISFGAGLDQRVTLFDRPKLKSLEQIFKHGLQAIGRHRAAEAKARAKAAKPKRGAAKRRKQAA